ncbi:MAG: M42 family metallopeptidase [Ignavibacteriales bacterium]
MLLKRLSEAAGVSGDEGEVRRIILEEVERLGLCAQVDVLGNVMVQGRLRQGDHLAPKVMLAAHMDEVGLIVTYIEKDGLLRFGAVGIDERVLPAKEVTVGRDRVRGVIGLKPVHLQEPDERKKVVKRDNLFIDIGARSREDAEKKVKVGDYACFRCRFDKMGEKAFKGKAFDDRAGCAVLLRVLENAYSFPLVAVFTVQEEVGLRGAAVASWAVAPDMALVLEATICSDTPGTDDHMQATRLGDGPALSIMDGRSIASKTMLKGLIEAATSRDIPYQFKRSTMGGNDAGRIHLTRTGVPTASVSVPCRYLHSPASIISVEDFDNTVKLVTAFLESVEEGFRP